MKAIVLYDTKTGHTQQMADYIVEGMHQIPSVEAKACSLEKIDVDWAVESKCLILGSPTYVSSISAATKIWLDGPSRHCALAGKLGGAFATEDYIHGGGDLAIREILDHMMTYGMLTYSGGGACGKPVIHLGPVAVSGHLEDCAETFRIYGRRMAAKAAELFGGCDAD